LRRRRRPCAKPPSAREVINDIDGELINLYRQVKWHLPAVVAQLSMVTESRELFHDAKEHPGATEIHRAASFAYRNFYSFGGDNDSFGVKRVGFSTRTWLITKMVAMHHRLNRVCVEHLSWERCISLYDSPDTLFFCDPPYTVGEVKTYAAWTGDNAAQLARALASAKGRWVVTLNDCEANRAAFRGCTFAAVTTHANMSSK
jgi:DNA adenine methylase